MNKSKKWYVARAAETRAVGACINYHEIMTSNVGGNSWLNGACAAAIHHKTAEL